MFALCRFESDLRHQSSLGSSRFPRRASYFWLRQFFEGRSSLKKATASDEAKGEDGRLPEIAVGDDGLIFLILALFIYQGQPNLKRDLKKGSISMFDAQCLFCKIIAKLIPAKIILENNDVMVIQDIAPKAPVHYLILPKIHVKDVKSLDENNSAVVVPMMLMAQELSSHLSGSGAFRLIINNGADAGQSVFHMHFHFLSGKKMLDF
ncbi:MAG: HIT domain-containing protein [Candidatus Dependentiae bacterium]|nr:HIT domain-containing protein [Candidatus Dependentiae bacterium]